MPRAIIFNPDAAETISDYPMQRVEFSCSSGGHATGATNEQVTGLSRAWPESHLVRPGRREMHEEFWLRNSVARFVFDREITHDITIPLLEIWTIVGPAVHRSTSSSRQIITVQRFPTKEDV